MFGRTASITKDNQCQKLAQPWIPLPVNAFNNKGIPILACNVQRNSPLFFFVGLMPLQCSTELTVYNCEDRFHIHIFICSSNIRLSYIFTAVYSPLHGFIWNQHSDQLPVGLLAQLVEHCTCIAEVMVSNPVQAWIFFRPSFHYCLRGCLSYFHLLNFASKIIFPETLSTERLYLGKN